MTVRKKIAIGVAPLLFLAALVPVHHLWSQFTQIGICCDMAACVQYLEEYRKQNGEYPPSLRDALPGDRRDRCAEDRWGNPYFYESSSDRFVLVSPGKHGEADFSGYWELRAESPESADSRSIENAINVLGQPEADQIVSDRGWYQHAAP